MAYTNIIYWLGLLALPCAALPLLHVIRGLRRGWFHCRDGVTRIKREVNPGVFWFEVSASLVLAMGLTSISILAAARLIGADT
jgi:hypothetical protein